jgi:hypothetical protein
MTDCLVYWQRYKRAINGFGEDDEEYREIATAHWATSSEKFLRQVKPRDSLWVVVWAEGKHTNGWRLLQRIYLRERPKLNRLIQSDDGEYHVDGDLRKSQLFRLYGQSDFTPILRKMTFRSGKRITAKGRRIGNSIQSIRPLSDFDVVLLQNYVRKLKKID